MQLKDKKLIILDRDGVINRDCVNFIKTPDEWIEIAGSIDAIKILNDAGLKVAIATNQSGIGRGLFTEETLHEIHQKMQFLLAEKGARIDAIVYCPHKPDDNCDCRKPKSGMFLQLLEMFSIEAKDAVLIGDSLRDIQAAEAVGVDAILVKTGKGETTLSENALENPVYDDLYSFVKAHWGG